MIKLKLTDYLQEIVAMRFSRLAVASLILVINTEQMFNKITLYFSFVKDINISSFGVNFMYVRSITEFIYILGCLFGILFAIILLKSNTIQHLNSKYIGAMFLLKSLSIILFTLYININTGRSIIQLGVETILTYLFNIISLFFGVFLVLDIKYKKYMSLIFTSAPLLKISLLMLNLNNIHNFSTNPQTLYINLIQIATLTATMITLSYFILNVATNTEYQIVISKKSFQALKIMFFFYGLYRLLIFLDIVYFNKTILANNLVTVYGPQFGIYFALFYILLNSLTATIPFIIIQSLPSPRTTPQ